MENEPQNSPEEKEKATSRDPLLLARARLVETGVSRDALAELETEAATSVAAWFKEARGLPLPEVASAHEGVYA